LEAGASEQGEAVLSRGLAGLSQTTPACSTKRLIAGPLPTPTTGPTKLLSSPPALRKSPLILP